MKRHLLTGLCVAIVASTASVADVTYTRDVAPIFQEKCVQCHRPGDIGPMALEDYTQARAWAKSIKKAVTEKVMPPWGAEDGPHAFANNPSLTSEELETIVAWVDQGAPRGAQADMPPPRVFEDDEFDAGTPDLVLDTGSDYVLGADVDDEYRCFCLDTEFEQDVWVDGIEYLPGNRKVVHHIMAYADPSRKSLEKDAADPEAGFLCGMSGDQGTLRLDMLLGGWAPGVAPNMFEDGVAKLIPKGSVIVYQVHYHNESGEDQTDRSKMGLFFARDTIRAKAQILPVGQFYLDIPAGEPNYESKGVFVAPKDVILGSLMPHMHYIGKDMTVDITYPDGRKERVLEVPRYDFNWQIVYAFEEPLNLPKGTRIDMVAHHDNSADNPANRFNPPIDVKWGEATHEEMSHVWLGYTYADENLDIQPVPPVIEGRSD